MFLLNVSLSWGVVVLGMMLLMRTGLVSFGQGLYYCLGAYAAGVLYSKYQVTDIAVMLLASIVVTGAGRRPCSGLLLAKYRDIFFAMLSLAFSMILFGLLVRSSELGSTDGFGLSVGALAGVKLRAGLGSLRCVRVRCRFGFRFGVGIHRYLSSHLGRLAGAIRDNELRVEYMGASVRRVIHLNYVIGAVLAGLGGGLVAITIGHVDPEMAYWTTSGEFVFIAILAGTGNVLAPFLGATIFETVRSYRLRVLPQHLADGAGHHHAPGDHVPARRAVVDVRARTQGGLTWQSSWKHATSTRPSARSPLRRTSTCASSRTAWWA